MDAGILGVGRYEAGRIVTNFDLEEIMDTNDEWIRSRTGIEERRIAPEGVSTSDMAEVAARKALQDAKLLAEEIDLILVATVTPDYGFPSVACMLQDKLGAKKAAAMDIGAACAGFMYAIVTAKQFFDSGTYRHILVVGAEKMSSILDWKDRSTAVLFGDGAGAMVVGPVSSGKGFLSFELGSDGSGGKHLFFDDVLKMNGREVFRFAVRQMGQTAVNVIKKAHLSPGDVDFFVPHQANIRIMESACHRIGLPKRKMSTIVRMYGNTSSSSIPIALIEELNHGNIHDGDIIVMVGFGGGLTWGGAVLRWGI